MICINYWKCEVFKKDKYTFLPHFHKKKSEDSFSTYSFSRSNDREDYKICTFPEIGRASVMDSHIIILNYYK